MGKKITYTYNNKTLSTSEWCRYIGISREAFYRRLKKYYPAFPEKVFSLEYLQGGGNCKQTREEYEKYREQHELNNCS